MIHFLCLGSNNLLENLKSGSNNLLDYKRRLTERWETAYLLASTRENRR